MSITAELPSFANIVARYRFAYLMTSSAKGAPHAVPVAAVLQGGDLVVNGIGRRTRENALARPAVGLIWPPQSEAGYSLIVDGQAAVTGESLRITPTRAVLHRPAPSPEPSVSGACGSDCVELNLSI
jgi:pyridoxamine 5'-phosphate oxidase-like protein